MADLDSSDVNNLEVGVIGSGSMGAVSKLVYVVQPADEKGMTLLFSEHGSRVGCFDTDEEAVKTVLQQAKEDKVVGEKLVHGFSSLDKLVEAFPSGTSTRNGLTTNGRWKTATNACPISTPR
jgi:6-phosphogluconate dehydrogenase